MISIANDKGVGALLGPKFAVRSIPYRLVNNQPSSDFVFSGNGPDDLITIGIERKTLPDLIACMHSARLATKQIPKMLEWFDLSYLLVEGIYKAGAHGELLEFVYGGWRDVRSGRVTYDQVANFLTTITVMTDNRIQLLWTPDAEQTAATVCAMYSWFQRPWGSHSSFQAFHTAPPKRPIINQPTEEMLRRGEITSEEWKAWNCRLFSKEIRGIGWDLSEAVAKHFGTVRKAVLASTKEWQEIPGIGPKLAKRVDEAL